MVYFKYKPKPQPRMSELGGAPSPLAAQKFIPVIAIMDMQDFKRVLFCRSYHERRMAETNKDEDPTDFQRHRQIWKECDRRIKQFDETRHG